MSFSLMLWKFAGAPISPADARSVYQQFVEEGRLSIASGGEEIKTFISHLDRVFSEAVDAVDSPWAGVPHEKSDNYVLLAVSGPRIAEVMDVVIPLARKVGLNCFIPEANQLYIPTDEYTPTKSAGPTWDQIDEWLHKGTGSASIEDELLHTISPELESMGLRCKTKGAFSREANETKHLFFLKVRHFIDGEIRLRASVGVRFDELEDLKCEALPAVMQGAGDLVPTVFSQLWQLDETLPRTWHLTSSAEAKESGRRILGSIGQHVEPYYQAYSNRQTVLEALLSGSEDVVKLDSNPFSRAMTVVGLSYLTDVGKLTAAIEGMDKVVESEGLSAVRLFEAFSENLRTRAGGG